MAEEEEELGKRRGRGTAACGCNQILSAMRPKQLVLLGDQPEEAACNKKDFLQRLKPAHICTKRNKHGKSPPAIDCTDSTRMVKEEVPIPSLPLAHPLRVAADSFESTV